MSVRPIISTINNTLQLNYIIMSLTLRELKFIVLSSLAGTMYYWLLQFMDSRNDRIVLDGQHSADKLNEYVKYERTRVDNIANAIRLVACDDESMPASDSFPGTCTPD